VALLPCCFAVLPCCRRDIQQQVFATIGLSDDEARAKFGYLLDSFEIGAPPHGGEFRAVPQFRTVPQKSK
jgi:hypothetical protein